MADFDLVDILVKVFNDLMSYIDIEHKFMCELSESSLNSGEPVNVIIGLTGEMEGNLIFGYNEKTAKEIAAKLIGVEEVDEIDIYSQAALSDFSHEFCKRVVDMIKREHSMLVLTAEGPSENLKQKYDLFTSYPSYISGNDMYAMIGKVASKNLFFKVNGKKFNLSYSLQ